MLVPECHLPAVADNQQFRKSSKSFATCWYMVVIVLVALILETTLWAIVSFMIILGFEW